MPNEHLESIAEAIEAHSVNAFFMRPDQLVVSTSEYITMPNNGNSFWITYKDDCFYVCTWFPRCYQVPSSSNVVMLAVEFARCSKTVETEIPVKIIAKFGISLMNDDYVP